MSNLTATVSSIIADVRAKGDAALARYALRFDGQKLNFKNFALGPKEAERALRRIPSPLRQALALAARRIRFFHAQEMRRLPRNWQAHFDGIKVGQRFSPLERVGIYVPGGRYSYPSTVLMTAIPAKTAGVKTVVMVSPQKNLSDSVLAAAALAGVDKIYPVGGAQAVAALALGTQSISPVQKIVGPGNAYVTEAKRQLYGEVGIDSLAGPSEVAVWADETTPVLSAARNLLAQAEHDPSACAYVLSLSSKALSAIKNTVAQELKQHKLPFTPAIFYEKFSALEALIARSNELAPEHLFLALSKPRQYLSRIHCAGAVFLGVNTPVPLGDYAAGPSHVLPTMRSARFGSGLSVKDFWRSSSIMETCGRPALKALKAAKLLAETEGLYYHARSLEIDL